MYACFIHLQCMLILSRHWIAVFGQVFKRNVKTTVEDLRKHFSRGGGTVMKIKVML